MQGRLPSRISRTAGPDSDCGNWYKEPIKAEQQSGKSSSETKKIMTVQYPEYHSLFSDDEGPVEVRVKFKDEPAWIPKKRMHADEIRKLVKCDANGFLRRMTFDDHDYEVYKYEIDPQKNRLTIYARSLPASDPQDETL